MSFWQEDLFGPTLADAKEKTMRDARRSEGTRCPCCTKYVKVYRRKFNSGMARTMVYAYRHFRDHNDFIDIAHYMLKQLPNIVPSDYGKLCWWGLLERSPEEPDPKKKSSGMYRMTEKGRRFVEKQITIPSHAIEYRSQVEEFDGEQIDIVEALGEDNQFHYQELMTDRPYV